MNLTADGAPCNVVELPVEWIRDDAIYFSTDTWSTLRPLIAPQDVLGISSSANLMPHTKKAGLFQLTMHPDVIGHRSRIWLLESPDRTYPGSKWHLVRNTCRRRPACEGQLPLTSCTV